MSEKLPKAVQEAMEKASDLLGSADPNDADVIWVAAVAVSEAYGWTTADAINRMASIDWKPF